MDENNRRDNNWNESPPQSVPTPQPKSSDPAPNTEWQDASFQQATEGQQENAQAAPPHPGTTRNQKPPKGKKEKRSIGIVGIVALCLVCALLGGLANPVYQHLAGTSSKDAISLTTGERTIPDDTTRTVDTSAEMDPAEIYAAYVNSTVGINVDIVTTNVWGQTVTGAAAGSGFIITEDGYILTNYHVIDKANAINVAFSDGTTYPATLIGGEEENDIAVIKIDAEGLTPVVLGKSSDMKVGETVIAIGNPLGELTFTETQGIVSALNRVITMSDGRKMNMIQTDCAINSGNSGGPLFNSHGEVIGITSAKYSSSGYSTTASVEGIGFAIPIDDVSAMVQDLVEKGYVTGKPYVGIIMDQNGVSESAQAYGIPAGVPVLGVTPGLAAAEAGIQEGDIIVKVGDTETSSGGALATAVNQTKPGDQVTFTVYRNGETMDITVTIGEETAEADAATKKISDEIEKKRQEEQQQQYQQQQQQQQQSGGYYWPFGSFGFGY